MSSENSYKIEPEVDEITKLDFTFGS